MRRRQRTKEEETEICSSEAGTQTFSSAAGAIAITNPDTTEANALAEAEPVAKESIARAQQKGWHFRSIIACGERCIVEASLGDTLAVVS